MALLPGTFQYSDCGAEETCLRHVSYGLRGLAHLCVGRVSKALGAGPQQRLRAQRAVLRKQRAGADPALGNVQVLGRLHEPRNVRGCDSTAVHLKAAWTGQCMPKAQNVQSDAATALEHVKHMLRAATAPICSH